MTLPDPLLRLIEELQPLPGIGPKGAQRLAFHILRAKPEEALALADSIRDAKLNMRLCSVCNNVTDADPCLYCTGSSRDRKTICVVEEPQRGIGPDQLHLKSLIERLKGGTVEEIIIATNPNAEGEATAMYLSKLIKPLGVRVTRIGVGIPVGSDLEYADEVTMMKAMEGRREL